MRDRRGTAMSGQATRRSQAPYLIALLALVPLAVGVEYHLERDAVRGPMHEAVTASADESVDYAGARWKLTSTAPGPPAEDVELPRKAVVLYAAFSVTPRDARAAKRIEACDFSATDDDGRVWATAPTDVPDFAGSADLPTGCYTPKGDFGQMPIVAGKRQQVVTAFVVPKDVVPRLRLRVGVRDAAPRYLEFSRDHVRDHESSVDLWPAFPS
ncbi:hypothetical protein ABNF93_20370 [Actinopolymorpha sp. B9G3]|uniref:hypothetical protein n=2 Tax=unclassified Actinopolymorpha TaxID=2627063 RepID=UPI0032DDA8CC